MLVFVHRDLEYSHSFSIVGHLLLRMCSSWTCSAEKNLWQMPTVWTSNLEFSCVENLGMWHEQCSRLDFRDPIIYWIPIQYSWWWLPNIARSYIVNYTNPNWPLKCPSAGENHLRTRCPQAKLSVSSISTLPKHCALVGLLFKCTSRRVWGYLMMWSCSPVVMTWPPCTLSGVGKGGQVHGLLLYFTS